jgi:hypothetical protein
MLDKESWVYKSGDIWLPPKTVKFLHTYVIGNDSTLFYINYWHGMHMLSGVLFGLFHNYFFHFHHPYFVYFVIHTLWEIWQLSIGMTKRNLRAAIDIVVDTCMGLFGLFLSIRFI